MHTNRIGCIADDFTGASDACSFFVQGGLKTILLSGIPTEKVDFGNEYQAIVIALKTRTQETTSAVKESLLAAKWLKENGAEQLYIKYCSTFDSTPKGNIGPIVDAVMEEYNVRYTILCPALPVNKRIVKNGSLYVNGVPLHESSMKNHPLTPMWDADIEKLMAPQGKYKCLKIDAATMKLQKAQIQKIIDDFGADKKHFYIIPDFIEDNDAKKLVEVFGDLPLLTGGSGLMKELGRHYADKAEIHSNTIGRGLILSGSCSDATLKQVEHFKAHGGLSKKIYPLELLEGKQTIEELWEFIENNIDQDVLIYSSSKAQAVQDVQRVATQKISEILEDTMAKLAARALENGVTRIVVAGGETSGAVTRELGFNSFIIGESVAPGVPVMVPLKNKDIRLILKSGNFGQEDFFCRALEMTKGKNNE